jgi:lipopolysaccharide export system permease protein
MLASMTIQRHMFVRMLVALLVVTSTLTGLLILAALFTNVPSAVLYSRAVFPFVLGAIPINFCNVLPVSVAIVAVWYYIDLAADHAIHALYATGFSHFSVILPGLLLALLATAFGFYLSLIEVPRGWGRLLDATYTATHDVDPSKLEPQRFYSLNNNGRTFYFGGWLTDDEISDVFMQERTIDGGERSISAPVGRFVRTPGATLLYLTDAVVQTRRAGDRAPAISSVNRLSIDTGTRGTSTPERTARYIVELGSAALAASYDRGDANYRREWLDEAFKRTVPPILTVIYLLVGVRLALVGLGGRRETPWKFYAICLGAFLHHGVFLITIDALISLDSRLAWAVVAAVVIEIGVAIAINSVVPASVRKTQLSSSHQSALHDCGPFSAGPIASEINEVS